MEIRCLHEGRFKLAEGPVWCDRTQAVWWVNMVDTPAVYRLGWGTDTPQVFPAPLPVTGLALTEGDHLLVGSVGEVLRLDPRAGSFTRAIRLEEDRPGNRCNELGVDPAGNLWVGTMTNNLDGTAVDPGAGALIRIAADGRQRVMQDGIGIPNTLVWTAEGDLLTADSVTGVISRLRLDGSGAVASATPLHGPIDLGVPDGSALAVDGTLWNARWSGGCLIGIAPDGTEAARIGIPGGNITSACFAGPNLDMLVVTSSGWGLLAEDRASLPQAGGIFAVTGAGHGRPVARFA